MFAEWRTKQQHLKVTTVQPVEASEEVSVDEAAVEDVVVEDHAAEEDAVAVAARKTRNGSL